MRALIGPQLDANAQPRDCRKTRDLTPCCARRAWQRSLKPVTPTTHCRSVRPRLVNCRIFPGHSKEEIRQALQRIVADDKLKISSTWRRIKRRHDTAPDDKSLAPPTIRRRLAEGAGSNLDANVARCSRDSGNGNGRVGQHLHARGAGIPSYGVSGVAIDRDDMRAHGRDERLRISSFYEGLDFYGRLLKLLTSH